MAFESQRQQFATEGYAVFPGVLDAAVLEMLRQQCNAFIAREDSRIDALGVDSIGITHRGRRYFANQSQRTQPALRAMLFSPMMADAVPLLLNGEIATVA